MQAKHLRWLGLLTVTAFLAMAWTPTAAALPDVPCEAVPVGPAHETCQRVEHRANGDQQAACRTAHPTIADVAGQDAASMAYETCRSL